LERRKPHFADFAAIHHEADQFLKHGYERLGKWSLGQMATHLAILVEMSVRGFPWYVPWPLTLPFRWFALGGILRRKQFGAGLQGPKFAMPPETVEDRAGLDRLVAAFAEFDAATRVYPSPLFGSLTHEQWREVHLWHAEHHLSFLIPRTAEPSA
jgi:hypothetical protein